jgi:hypothetical protein
VFRATVCRPQRSEHARLSATKRLRRHGDAPRDGALGELIADLAPEFPVLRKTLVVYRVIKCTIFPNCGEVHRFIGKVRTSDLLIQIDC